MEKEEAKGGRLPSLLDARVSKHSQDLSSVSLLDLVPIEDIIYEWESELDAYDNPDDYPSERDYQWVEEIVEITEGSEAEAPPVPELVLDASHVEQEEDQKSSEGKKDDSKPVRPQHTTEEEKEEDEEVFEKEDPDADDERLSEGPKRHYKTIRVKKLIERPPKIHYDPDLERVDHFTDNPYYYTSRPFNLFHSFGYDCQRMANLHVLDETTLVFMSGFVLTFFNPTSGQKSYLRCIGGSCFGALAVHPSKRLFAAAEKGENPIIGIWSWPQLQLFRKLKEGTHQAYAYVNFSPDGKLLASQGGEPDYLITVWDWLKEQPVVRVKSHAQDVYRVTFSKELEGNLTSSGLCHIKFWKMAATFTGLKLQSNIGRFGKTELSDIEGFVQMPDGKVVSGTEWGNLLVWENGLIVAEICSQFDIPCHAGIVRQVMLHEGDFFTSGQDGYIRTWNFDAIDTAEIQTTEESSKVPLKSTNEVLVNETADIWYLVQDVFDHSSPSVFWFAQDGKGFIWKVDLSFLNVAKNPRVVLSAHGGSIVACKACPSNYIMATLGTDGAVRVHNYISKELLAARLFNTPGKVLVWPPGSFDETACTLIAGFTNGVFRVLRLSGIQKEKDTPMSLVLENVQKPHDDEISCMAFHDQGEYFVTGSLDGTIFFFDAKQNFKPMVFVKMPDDLPVRDVQWARNSLDTDPLRVLVVLDNAIIQEVLMPTWDEIDNETTFLHPKDVFLRRYEFKSIKSVIRHNDELEQERIEEEKRQAKINVENMRLIEEKLETQSQQDLRLLGEAEDNAQRVREEEDRKRQWKPFIPSEPSPILQMIQSPTEEDCMILSMGKYDSGYLYIVKLKSDEEKEKLGAKADKPEDAVSLMDDAPVTCMKLSPSANEIYMGYHDGRIRLQHLMYPCGFDELGPHWTEGIHDCIRGCITDISFDKDYNIMFTCGLDGNCFMHSLLPVHSLQEILDNAIVNEIPKVQQSTTVHDITMPDAFTLEVLKTAEKKMELLAAAKRRKLQKKEEISRLRALFGELLRRNQELPADVRLSPVEFCLSVDNKSRQEERLNSSLDLLHKEMAWEVQKCQIALDKFQNFYLGPMDDGLFALAAFKSPMRVSSFRIQALPKFFEEAKDKILHQVTPKRTVSDIYDDEGSGNESTEFEFEPKPKREPWMGKWDYKRAIRLWKRQMQKYTRHMQWKEFLHSEPTDRELLEEDKAIDEAWQNMGDMKLKTDPGYRVPAEKKLTTHRARKRLVVLEEMMHVMQLKFNKKLKDLRENKVKRIALMQDYTKTLEQYQLDLPQQEVQPIPEYKQMEPFEDPDYMVKIKEDDVREFKRKLEAGGLVGNDDRLLKNKKDDPGAKRRGPGKRASLIKSPEIEKFAHEMREDLGAYVHHIKSERSHLETQIRHAKVTKARFYQTYYIQCIEKEQSDFDACLNLLRHEKMKLGFQMKIAEERMNMLTEEFILAQNSETMEESIENEILKSSKEKKECTVEMKLLTKRLENVKKELESISKQRTALYNEVVVIAKEAPNFEKYLMRVFRKKINRNLKTAVEFDEDGSEGSDDDSDDEDFDMDEDDDDDDGYDVDFPPIELNKDVYDAILEVRSRRLGVDDLEERARTKYDELTSGIQGYKIRIVAAERAFETSKNELILFMKEIQKKQNSLDCAVGLEMHQIFHMDANLDRALITHCQAIDNLRKRIPELKQEKKEQKKKVNETKRTYYCLQKDKRHFAAKLDEMDAKCDKEMMKKFGHVVDIKVLENFVKDPDVVNVQREFDNIRENYFQTMDDLNRTILDVQCRRRVVNEELSCKMIMKSELYSQLNAMTSGMEAFVKKIPEEAADVTKQKEKKLLNQLILEQWKTISFLRSEIRYLTKSSVPPLPPIKEAEPQQAQATSTQPSQRERRSQSEAPGQEASGMGP